ncbi:MAG: RNA-guided pseudouridylation complex pseudouridine synthase subunit Cbf5 [Thermoplasmata archaeon]
MSDGVEKDNASCKIPDSTGSQWKSEILKKVLPAGSFLCVEDFTTTTDERYGTYPEKRSIEQRLSSGVVNLDKPAGPTSHQVSAWVREMLGLEKAGHAGTLDPQVTGVLPVLLSRATSAISALHFGSKEYVALMHLHHVLPEEDIRKTFAQFKGLLYQTPPLKSAVKKRLRLRTVFELEILQIKERFVLFRVEAEAGTYIRTLCTDIGYALGCYAQLHELRRTRTGPFLEKDSVTLHQLKDAFSVYNEGNPTLLAKVIKPLEELLAHLPAAVIRDSAVDAICRGAVLHAPGLLACDKRVRKGMICVLYSLKGEAVAISEACENAEKMTTMKKGDCFRTIRCLMKAGTYPSGWPGAKSDADE